MTSTPVTDIVQKNVYTRDIGGTLPSSSGDFMGNLQTAIETQSSLVNDIKSAPASDNSFLEKNVSDKVKKIDTGNRVDSGQKEAKSEVKKGSNTADTKGKSNKITSEQTEAIDKAATEVAQEIANQMGVPYEAVMDAMESLGLNIPDLLDPTNMTDLVSTLSGNQDVVSLLTDENLYQTLGELQNFVNQVTEDLCTKLDLSQEALNMVLEQAEELHEQPVTMEETIPYVQADTAAPMENMRDYKSTTVVDGKEVTVNSAMDESTGVQITTIESTGESHLGQDSKGSSNENNFEKDDNSQDSTFLFTPSAQVNNVNTLDFNQLANQINGFNGETADIANQILDSMKANFKPEMTELEMNLHPASLGNVRVSLTAQNGQVTAQFVAQNEAVRSAIESQITQLTNQLEDQGIKVEHVEVSIADYRFDRGTGSDTGEQRNSQNKPGKAKTGRVRRIDLNAIDDDYEELEESDRIAASMMEQNGNSVDYTV